MSELEKVNCDEISQSVLICNDNADDKQHYYLKKETCNTHKCKDNHTWHIFMTGLCISAFAFLVCAFITDWNQQSPPNRQKLNKYYTRFTFIAFICFVVYLIPTIMFVIAQNNDYNNSCTKQPTNKKLNFINCQNENNKRYKGNKDKLEGTLGGNYHWIHVGFIGLCGLIGAYFCYKCYKEDAAPSTQ
jgi:hypothetical protein